MQATGMKRAALAAATLLCSCVVSPSLADAVAARLAETVVEAQVEEGVLKGYMLLPGDRSGQPVAVIIPGSGPTDHDGNNPLGIKAGYLKMLAEELAEKEIGSIRIDKRGMFASTTGFPDANDVRMTDYAGDAIAWLKVAREKAGTDCAWLVGHSEGGLVALIAAQMAGPDLCGVVLVSAPGRPLGEILREQFTGNPANRPVLPQLLEATRTLERGEKVDVASLPGIVRPLFPESIQGFLIDLLSYKPAELIAKLRVPVLIVQGDNDLQVRVVDAKNLSQAQPSSQLKIFPGMNHVLKETPKDNLIANFAAYGDAEMPLAAGLSDEIAGFMAGRR